MNQLDIKKKLNSGGITSRVFLSPVGKVFEYADDSLERCKTPQMGP